MITRIYLSHGKAKAAVAAQKGAVRSAETDSAVMSTVPSIVRDVPSIPQMAQTIQARRMREAGMRHRMRCSHSALICFLRC